MTDIALLWRPRYTWLRTADWVPSRAC